MPDSGLRAIPYKEHLIHTAVKAYLKRVSAAAPTRPRPAVRGAGSGASSGARRAPAVPVSASSAAAVARRRTVHGPQPRSYDLENERSARRSNALKSALSRKLADDGIVVSRISISSRTRPRSWSRPDRSRARAQGCCWSTRCTDNENLSWPRATTPAQDGRRARRSTSTTSSTAITSSSARRRSTPGGGAGR